MILPPPLFLKAMRILGSVRFVAGATAFTVCVLQVYLGKILPTESEHPLILGRRSAPPTAARLQPAAKPTKPLAVALFEGEP
jgi:hypothetical protein